MLTVLHLITGLETGGAQRALSRLVASSDRNRFRSVVISMTDAGALGSVIVAAGTEVRSLELPGAVPTPGGVLRLARMVRELRPDIVQTWLYHADLLGLVATAVSPVPHLLWNIRCSEVAFSPCRRAVFQFLVWSSRLPDAVIVNSLAGQRVHQAAGYRPRQWELIPNGFDTDELKPDRDIRDSVRAQWGIGHGDVVVALPARFHPMKDPATFLAAAVRLAERRPAVRFMLIGAGFEPGNPAVAAMVPPQLAGRIALLGERSDLARLYPALDIVSLSSSYGEGFPNVLGEAMACGIPCVATDSGDARGLIGETGLVVPPRDPEALALAWERLVALGSAGRRALGSAARALIKSNYALGPIVARYEALYEEIVARGLGAAGVPHDIARRDGGAPQQVGC
jgi:glycosyltransferase involved in cell wall biosynthesis